MLKNVLKILISNLAVLTSALYFFNEIFVFVRSRNQQKYISFIRSGSVNISLSELLHLTEFRLVSKNP